MTADPAAIRHILHTMGYDYPKTRFIRQFAALAFGRGVAWAAGELYILNCAAQRLGIGAAIENIKRCSS
jgi:hypothetical protein